MTKYVFGHPEPITAQFGVSEFNQLLVRLRDRGCSDIFFKSDDCIWARLDGRMTRVTEDEIDAKIIREHIARDKGEGYANSIATGTPSSWAYRVRESAERTGRFRLSAASIADSSTSTGFRLVCRPISALPPNFNELDLPEELKSALVHENGIALVTGPTGSGKTTCLFSVILHRLVYGPGEHLATIEDPIEFDLNNLPEDLESIRTGVIGQEEYITNVAGFSVALKGLLRDNPDVILVGEMRDPETIRLSLEASLTGHAVYSTVHVTDASSALARVTMNFPESEQTNMAASLISSLRVITCQRLLPKLGGGRCAITEYVLFAPEDREQLKVAFMKGGLIAAEGAIRERVGQGIRAMSFTQAAKQRFDQGFISEQQFAEQQLEFGEWRDHQ
ncbi:type IV pilus twitching motility protein PilT [Marinobacterium jannaschii]|uniref:type IV pilus twitching motility protein PilT n=1 Tax=Marinobacterium jannaschii TaxID=64970 RepID=UPI000688E303|nr:ATPase, T2SS/T4P/T4SS family [Marinobacterium jannaschii]